MRRILDYRNILNRKHPLNRGLVSEWVVLPGLAGGKYLFDIVSQNHGTLTNGPIWTPSSRPGGLGSLAMDATTNARVQLDHTKLHLQAITVLAAVRLVDVGPDENYRNLLTIGIVAGGGAAGNYPFYMSLGGGRPNVYTIAAGTWLTGSGGVSANTWAWVGGGTDGTTRKVWANGESVGSGGDGGAPVYTETNAAYIGDRVDGLIANAALGGYVGELLIFNRLLSDAEVARWTHESRAGNPNRYNWLYPERMSYLEYVTKTVPIGINYNQYFNIQYTEQR